MRPYIVNLTDNWIGKYRIAEMWDIASAPGPDIIGRKRNFAPYISRFLLEKEVRIMSAATLGEIVCSAERGEMGFKEPEDLHRIIPSFGPDEDPEIMLRQLAAHFLATAITMRLWTESIPMANCSLVPPYRMKPDSLRFQRFGRARDGRVVALFVNGLGDELVFTRPAVADVTATGDPIWSELLANWPS